MKVTYLNNSGFLMEKGNQALVVDCFDPEAHPALMADKLSGYDTVTVFASHIHDDHYSPVIFGLGGDPAFVLSFDIPANPGNFSLNPGESCEVNGMKVSAFGSTDLGVSFYLQFADGYKVFHAGDLNNWHWFDEGGEAYKQQAEGDFLRELEKVKAAIPAGTLDVAFFPVDPRMGSDYYRGAIQFAEALRPKVFIPMHFGAEFAPPEAFFEEIAPFTKVVPVCVKDEAVVVD